jgi:murein DD-endopeptidase / murein LD-carboxypeptidase
MLRTKRLGIKLLVGWLVILGACKVFEKTGKKDAPAPARNGETTGPAGGGAAGAARAAKALDRVIAATPDASLRRQLEDYKRGGVGQPLDIKNATPDLVIKAAEKYLGTPHRGGGRDRSGIDCAGLVSVAFEAHGVRLRGSSSTLARYGMIIADQGDLRRGDIVFFVRTYNAKEVLTHTGIYLGNDKFIHTSSSKGVVVSNFKDPSYWQPRYVFATRVFD